MAASEAAIAYDCTLQVETVPGSDVWFDIAELKSIMKPNPQVDRQEVTHMKSPGRAREFKAGLKDYGTVNYGINYIANGQVDNYIEEWFDEGDTRRVRLLVMPFNATRTFPAHPTGYPAEAGVGEVYEAELELSVDGEVERG